MSFKDKFKEIKSSCEDLLDIALIGKDGIIVETTFSSEVLESLTIEMSTILNKITTILEPFKDFVKEDILITEQHTILIKPISDYYFMVLFMKAGGNIGKARFIVRKNTLWFQEAIR